MACSVPRYGDASPEKVFGVVGPEFYESGDGMFVNPMRLVVEEDWVGSHPNSSYFTNEFGMVVEFKGPLVPIEVPFFDRVDDYENWRVKWLWRIIPHKPHMSMLCHSSDVEWVPAGNNERFRVCKEPCLEHDIEDCHKKSCVFFTAPACWVLQPAEDSDHDFEDDVYDCCFGSGLRPEGAVTEGGHVAFFRQVGAMLADGVEVPEEDWKMFLRLLVGNMSHWAQRPDATVKLCGCGFFVHRCFKCKVGEDVFEKRGFSNSKNFLSYVRTVLSQFELMTGRSIPVSEKEISISNVLNALLSRNPAIPISHRYASLKVLCAHLNVDSPVVREWIGVVEDIAMNDVFSLAAAVTPEFLDNMIHGFVDNVRVVLDFFGQVGVRVSDMLRAVVTKIREAVLAGKAWVGGVFAQLVEEALRDRINDVALRFRGRVLAIINHSMFSVMWKTMIRWWMGYALGSIALELVLDGGFTTMIAGMISTFIEGERNVVQPEAFDKSVILVIFVTLTMGMLFTLNPKLGNVDGKFLHSLCRNLSDAANAMDKLKVRDGINELLQYVYGVQISDAESSRFKIVYPSTMAFVDEFILYEALEYPSHFDKLKLKSRYIEYLIERLRWSKEDCSRLAQISSSAARKATELGATADFKTRRQPDFFLFYGEPGCGKSVLTSTIAKAIAEVELSGTGRDAMELVFSLDKNDKYFSGYANQSVWLIDEFLQKVDITGAPARDVEVLFNLCTTTPLTLNMAGLDEKGTIGRCYLILGSSNVPFGSAGTTPAAVMKPYIKSFVDPGAVARRVSHYVKPIILPPYRYDKETMKIYCDGDRCDSKMLVDPCKLYKFEVKESNGGIIRSPSGGEYWSYPELVEVIYESYISSAMFEPENSVEMTATRSILENYIQSSGRGDPKDLTDDKGKEQDFEGETGWGLGASVLVTAFTSWFTDSNLAAGLAGGLVFRGMANWQSCTCGRPFFVANEPPEECFDALRAQLTDLGVELDMKFKPKQGAVFLRDDQGKVEVDANPFRTYTRNEELIKYMRTYRRLWLAEVSDEPMFEKMFDYESYENSIYVARTTPGIGVSFRRKILRPRNLIEDRDGCLVVAESEMTAASDKFSSCECDDEQFEILGLRGKFLNISLIIQPIEWSHFSDDYLGAKYLDWVMMPLIGAIVGAGVCEAVRWVKSMVIVTDKGESRFDAETGLVVDMKEGERVMLAGRWYVQKKTKEGFKLYPQGGDLDDDLLEAVEVPARLASALPSIQDSLFAVVDSGDNLVGNIFAINSGQFLCPLHVARVLERKVGLRLKRDNFVRAVCPNTCDMTNVVVRQVGEGDLAVVEFLSTQIPIQLEKCRQHISKFMEDAAPTVGYARLCYRNHRGELVYNDGVFSKVDYPAAEYVIEEGGRDVLYRTPGERVREWDGPSATGFCGAIYLNMVKSADCPILGIHMARDHKRNRAVMQNVYAKDLRAVERSSVPINNTPVVLEPEGVTKEYLLKCGVTEIGAGERRHVADVSSKRKSWLYNKIDPQYDLAPLQPFVNDGGELVDPWGVALRRLGVKSLEDIKIEDGVMEVAREVGEFFREVYEDRPELSWPAVFSTECGLPSIRRKKAAGSQFKKLGSNKGIACVPDMEEPFPRDEWIKLLMMLEYRLAPDGWEKGLDLCLSYVAKCDACLKDEPLAKEKVQIGKTRLFTSVPVHEFLLERKYFAHLVEQMASKNLAFNSALGLSPADFGALHNKMMEAGEDALILTFDYKQMDGSVKLWMVRLVSLITHLIMSKRKGYVVDPDFPPFDREDFIRYRLMQRLACFVMSVFDATVALGTMHPSGSFLTCYINHMVQMVVMTWVLWKVLGGRYSIRTLLERVKMALLGDDSLIAVPRDIADGLYVPDIVEYARKLGYTLTGANHDDVFDEFSLWQRGPIHSEYIFLGRRFCEVGGEVYGMLEPHRLEKTLAFVSRKDAMDTFPQQMMAVLDELRYYRRSTDPMYQESLQKMRLILDEVEVGFCDWALDCIEGGVHSDVLLKCGKYVHRSLLRFVPEAGETTEALGGNTQVDTTTFVSNVVEDVSSVVLEEDIVLAEPGMEVAEHNEANVFARPFKVANFVWDATTPVNPVNLYLPSVFFNGYPNAQFKLANFAFLRGLMSIRVIISSTPYSSGKLLLSARPLGPLALTPYQATGDICAEIDAASGATAEICIATTIPQRWANVEKYDPSIVGPNPDFDWCVVQLFVASALAQVGVGSVNVAVYACIKEGALRAPTLTDFTLAPQAKGLSEQIAATAGFMKDEVVPMVKTVGGLVMECAAVLKTAATVAAFAGLSKPDMANNTTVVRNCENFGAVHMFGSSPAIKMCASQQQKTVMPEKIFNFKEDQMEISVFCSRPGLARKYEWNATDSVEAVIGKWRVNPGVCSGGVGVYNHIPLSYVAGMFRLWRGTIYYRLAIAKTRFHSGTIEVIWQMGLGVNDISSDFQATNCYRAVWDIQESSDFEIEVPYVSNLPWCATMIENSVDTSLPVKYCPTGFLSLHVVNPLGTALGQVTDSVEILVYTYGGKDMEFAIPCLYNDEFIGAPEKVFSDSTPPKLKGKGKEEMVRRGRFQPEVGGGVFQEDKTKEKETISPPLRMAQAMPSDVGSVISCVGERITNLRLLFKRMSAPTRKPIAATAGFFDGNPWAELSVQHPYVQYLSRSFAFFSGGVVIEFCVSIADFLFEFYNLQLLWCGTALPGMPVVSWYPGMADRRTMILDIPYQNIAPFVPMAMLGTTDAAKRLPYTYRASCSDVTLPFQFQVRYAGSDDFTMGWQIGPPALSGPNASAQNTPQYNNYF